MNYAPLAVGGVFIAVGLWWLLSAKNHFTGPVRTISFDEGVGIVEEDTFEPPPAGPPAATPA